MAGSPRDLGDYLDLAVRAYTLRADRAGSEAEINRPWRSRTVERVPRHLLIFDTETTTDRTQRLLFGCWRYVRLVGSGLQARLETVEEGLFYPDDLGSWNCSGLEVIEDHAARPREASVKPGLDSVGHLKVVPLSSFLSGQVWRAGYQLRAGVVCFNWPFDLSRLAWRAGRAIDRTPKKRDPIAGGFSLSIWRRGDEPSRRSRWRPDVGVKAIDSKRALKRFRSPEKVDEEDLVALDAEGRQRSPFRGNFIDLRTLSFALTDQSHSLESACDAFGVPYKKREVGHGVITPEYVQYCREDVEATTKLCEATLREFLRHPVPLQASRAYSPATIGKAYLREMGVRSPAEQKIDPKVLGHAMSAYYGGRAECRIRRTPVPVVYCDFLSMYPTVCALMGAWRLLRSQRMKINTEAGADVAALLGRTDLKTWLTPELWPQLIGISRIQPNDDVVPVRARYGSSPSWQIGVNSLTSAESMWFSNADLVASKLLTGKEPQVLESIQFSPGEPAAGLRPTSLLGAVDVDPRRVDFFVKTVEERKRSEAAGLDSRAKGLKVLANATSYGIYAQMTRHELSARRKEKVTVYSDTDQPWEWMDPAPEDPGDFCFPPLAAAITGGARLMLALLERQVTALGGSYAFCDTDSMAIVATPNGGPVEQTGLTALTWGQVDEIRERFEALNPYSPESVPGSVLELEDENFDAWGRRRQLWCYAISAKRYALYNRQAGGETGQHGEAGGAADTDGAQDVNRVSRKASQHGLGHLLNPIDPSLDDRDWIAEAWAYLIAKDLGQRYAEPEWLDRPAIAHSSISTPRLLRLFEGVNHRKLYRDRIKPFNFMLVAFVPMIERPAEEQRLVLVAPYEKDPRCWETLTWFGRFSGNEYRITTAPSAGRVIPRLVCVKSYRDVLDEYRVHPETKGADNGGAACGPATRGLLTRRAVRMRTMSHIGKEANRLEDIEVGLVEDLDEVQAEYDDYYRRVFKPLVIPVLRDLGVRETARRTGSSLGAASRVLAGLAVPRRSNMEKYVTVAALLTAQAGGPPIPGP